MRKFVKVKSTHTKKMLKNYEYRKMKIKMHNTIETKLIGSTHRM